MNRIQRKDEPLSKEELAIISAGFQRDTGQSGAPQYEKRSVNWLIHSDDDSLVGGLSADILWDWLYVDELWVHESLRGQGYGRKLMQEAEGHAQAEGLTGLWLWTQSWQAAPFYRKLGYEAFTEFPDFPKGFTRIGFRKQIVSAE